MLRVHLNTESGNKSIRDNKLGPTLDRVFAHIRPEQTWFLIESGRRTVYAIFDLKQPSDIPVIAEGMFMELSAQIELFPIMNAEELQAGIKQAMGA